MISIPRSWFYPSFADHHNGTAAGLRKNRRSLGLKAFHADRVRRWDRIVQGRAEVQLRRIRGSTRYVLRQVRVASSFFAVSAVNEEIGLGRAEWRKTRGMNRVRDSPRCVTLVSLPCSGELYRERNSYLGHNLGRSASAAPTFVILMILLA